MSRRADPLAGCRTAPVLYVRQSAQLEAVLAVLHVLSDLPADASDEIGRAHV